MTIYSITPKRHRSMHGVECMFYASRWFIDLPNRLQDLSFWADRQSRPVLIEISNTPNDIRRYSTEQVDEGVAKLKAQIDIARTKCPNGPIGVFATLPIWDEGAAIAGDDAWREANRYLQPLADLVDFVNPLIYMHADSPDPELWEKAAKAAIAEAEIYGKPIYPSIMPQYHHGMNSDLSYKMVPPLVWKKMLTLCRDRCDGAILFVGEGIQTDDDRWIHDLEKIA